VEAFFIVDDAHLAVALDSLNGTPLVQISRQERTLPPAPHEPHASSTAFQTAGAVRP
jgi:hypothetical protein